MRQVLRLGLLACGMAGAAGVAQVGAGGAAAPKEVIADGGLMHTLLAAPVIGEPFSAIEVTKRERMLADGTAIRGQGRGHAVMRDQAGRVRLEKRLSAPQDGSPGVMMVFVLDPMAHTLMTWSTGGKGAKEAVLLKLPEQTGVPQAPRSAQAARETGRPQPVVTTENLGMETLDGVPVDVVKTTTVVPAGRAGNDAPITKMHEVWTSPDLKLVMKQESTDPRSGEMTVWMSNFSRAEPDAAMFRPPAGYKVKDLKQTLEEMQQRLAELESKM